jgi:hypothetical protein
VRDEKSIDALADLLEVVASRIELEEARSAVGEQARVSEAYGRIAGSRVDEDLPLESVATPATSPRWISGGIRNGFGTASNAMSGTGDCA